MVQLLRHWALLPTGQEIGYKQLEVLEGERLTVHIRFEDEWWLVEMDSGDIGLVPGTYCEVFDGPDPFEDNASVLDVSGASSIPSTCAPAHLCTYMLGGGGVRAEVAEARMLKDAQMRLK